MAEALNWRTRLSLAVLLIALAGCASTGPPGVEQQRRAQVSRQLEALGQGLRGGTWSRVEQYFSPSYSEGYGELRDRMEASFRSQRIVDLQFTVNRVMETDGLVNAQVRWNKSWVDNSGKPGKASGVSEFVLQPMADGYRVVRISGDRLF